MIRNLMFQMNQVIIIKAKRIENKDIKGGLLITVRSIRFPVSPQCRLRRFLSLRRGIRGLRRLGMRMVSEYDLRNV